MGQGADGNPVLWGDLGVHRWRELKENPVLGGEEGVGGVGGGLKITQF